MVEKPMFSYMINGMNEIGMLPYLESDGETLKVPFERYLPLHQPGVLTSWLKKTVQPGSWILEPIGASPAAILELAEAGYKVLVAVNNPVVAFELTILAQAPARSEFQSVLRELSIQKKGAERLQGHILGLYETRCSACGKPVSADRFLWRKSETSPFAKVYGCSICGDEGEQPITDLDLERLAPFVRSDPLHRARALERVPGGTVTARANLEELVSFYPPRSLYALFTLINKLEGMSISPARRELLDALLLSALDSGHNLWPVAEGGERPRVLNAPSENIEFNIWQSLEAAIDLWACRDNPVQLTNWPDLPERAGICLYQGRMRDLQQHKADFQLDAMVCVLPRPNQVFWSFSTLWSSWLWGKENTANFKNVLERQRFDWYWHANALNSALAPAARMLKPGSPAFCTLPEPVAGFISAAFEACSAGGLRLSGLGWKNECEPIQSEWVTQPSNRETKKVNLQRIIHEAIHDCLSLVGEPCRYLQLHTAVIAALSAQSAFPGSIQQLTYDAATAIHAEINKVFADRKFLRRLDATAQDLDSGYWWFAQSSGGQASLADRVEIEVVKWLQKEKSIPMGEIQMTMNTRFSGFQTPPADLLEYCFSSYADLDPSLKSWKLKPHETSQVRKKDLVDIQSMLTELGGRMGFSSTGDNPMTWMGNDEPDKPVYKIYHSASSLLSRFLKDAGEEKCENVFLFPGSRSALLRFKLDRDPWLREKVSHGWHFLKFRTLRELARRKDISKDLWDLFIDSDPISLEDATQLSMFL